MTDELVDEVQDDAVPPPDTELPAHLTDLDNITITVRDVEGDGWVEVKVPRSADVDVRDVVHDAARKLGLNTADYTLLLQNGFAAPRTSRWRPFPGETVTLIPAEQAEEEKVAE